MYRYLSGLALQDADLAGVVRLISDRTAATVAVLTQLMDVLTAAAPGVTAEKAAADVREHMVHPRLGQVLRASRLSQRALRLPKVGGMPAIIVAPVLVGDEVPSYLITIDPAENLFGEDMSLLVTEHAATICGVILGRERVVAAAARRVRDDLVEGLLLGRGRDNADASRWAAHLGYDPARDHNVVAIAFDLPPSAAPREWRRSGSGSGRASSTSSPPGRPRRSSRPASPRWWWSPPPRWTRASSPPPAWPGCPSCSPRPRSSSGSAGPAATRATSRAPTRRRSAPPRRCSGLAGPGGAVSAFGDLGILRLLLQVPDLAELRSFAADVLGKLSMHEHEHKSEYLTTLACYFRENNSPQRASRILHVHPNTVAYRVKRIEEITGLRLDNYTDRLIAQVALEILDSLGDEP